MTVRVTAAMDSFVPKQLANWMKNTSKAKQEKILVAATDLGSLVDQLVQDDITDGGYLVPGDDEVLESLLSDWEKVKWDHPEFIPSVKHMQVDLVDELNGVVGHPDFLCDESKNGDWKYWGVTDLKCTSGIRDKNWVQVAKYAEMWMTMKALPFPSFLRIVRLDRDKEKSYQWLEIREPEMIQYLMRQFSRYLDLFNQEAIIKEYFRAFQETEVLGITTMEAEEIFNGGY